MVAVDGHPHLTADEAEALAHLEQEDLEPVDDGLLDVAFQHRRMFADIEELEHERILDHVGRRRDVLVVARERAHLVRVSVLGEALEQQRGDLALELRHGPAFARGFELVERTGGEVRNAEEDEVVGSSDRRRESWVRRRFAQ
ncbi:MAG TPA: hypothetical protein VFK02_23070 [Kofleriaceae bacterium]|nr:hypothetical protein [Kofleriaceae bacterium]